MQFHFQAGNKHFPTPPPLSLSPLHTTHPFPMDIMSVEKGGDLEFFCLKLLTRWARSRTCSTMTVRLTRV